MGTSFTPGPWKQVDPWQIEGQGGKTICALSPILPSVNRDMSIQEAAANRSLIAAAPDLLEALYKLARYEDGAQNFANDAIAKATCN